MKCKQVLLLAAVLAVAPSLSWGSGFALFEHGNRAMAMGGAFTAVADDPSALFWNPAGMAFQVDEGIQLMTGVTFIMTSQDFVGEAPYPGEGYSAAQKSQVFFPPHFYFAYPVNERLVLSAVAMTPFGLGTWWEDDFAGRFISKRADIKLIDLGVSMAYKLSDAVAVSIGVDYMIGTIDLTRNIGLVNPFNQRLSDVAQAHLYTDGLGNSDFAWNASLLWKLGGGFSVGGLYRSGFSINYEGFGSFTQFGTGYPEFDAVVGSLIPFDHNVPITTAIDFPDFWSLGLAWSNEKWTFSGQIGSMGWSSFDELPLIFPENPEFSTTVREDYTDADQYRLGLEYRATERWAFQLGYLFDETGQPVESMSPLLGDGDRDGYSAGISWISDWLRIDLGYMYLSLETRSTSGNSFDGYNGTYSGDAHLAGATFTFNF
ncbi:MAG: OmpP1/FadL family transporter [Thermoanaerobaculales bacterium]